MNPRGDQAGEMRHIHQEDRADGVGDLAEACEVDDPRVRRCRRR